MFLVKRLGMAAKADSLAAYEGTGLMPYHHAILALLEEGTTETQGAIAEALGYDKGQLVGMLDDLEQAGMIERRRDPGDRRRHVVQMTPAGKTALGRLRRLSADLEAKFLAPLGDADRAKLHLLLLRLAEHHVPSCAGMTAPGVPAGDRS
jgi:DNA-binding MarR family transcriptional regulator